MSDDFWFFLWFFLAVVVIVGMALTYYGWKYWVRHKYGFTTEEDHEKPVKPVNYFKGKTCTNCTKKAVISIDGDPYCRECAKGVI